MMKNGIGQLQGISFLLKRSNQMMTKEGIRVVAYILFLITSFVPIEVPKMYWFRSLYCL